MTKAIGRRDELDAERHALTLEALAAVVAGDVVHHPDVEAWADDETADGLEVLCIIG